MKIEIIKQGIFLVVDLDGVVILFTKAVLSNDIICLSMGGDFTTTTINTDSKYFDEMLEQLVGQGLL